MWYYQMISQVYVRSRAFTCCQKSVVSIITKDFELKRRMYRRKRGALSAFDLNTQLLKIAMDLMTDNAE